MTLFTVHRSSHATAYGGQSCESIFSHAQPLHFFFQLAIPVRRVAQQNCHRQYETRPWSMSPVGGDVTRQLDCAADRVPEFGQTCPVVNELAVEFSRC